MAFNFSEKEYESSVMIVDALNLAFRYKHQKKTTFGEEYVRTVHSLAASYEANDIIIAADKGSSSYRREIFPDYKGNRKEKYETQTEEEKAFFEEFISEYENTLEYCRQDGMTVLRYDKVEADDIAAHLVKNRHNYFPNRKVWMISSDKDWDLLIDEKVSRFSYVTRKEITFENWYEHYTCEPDQYISFKCLTGDSGDNVPGIPGVGPKRAQGLLDDFGDVFEIFNSVPLPGRSKYIQNLNENAEQLMTNLELMDLITYCDDAIGSDNVLDIKEQLSA